MSGPNSIRTELAAAFRAVNASYHRLPADRRPDVSWGATDDLLELALSSADRDRALEAVAEWKTTWLALFEEAAR